MRLVTFWDAVMDGRVFGPPNRQILSRSKKCGSDKPQFSMPLNKGFSHDCSLNRNFLQRLIARIWVATTSSRLGFASNDKISIVIIIPPQSRDTHRHRSDNLGS
jgi:hypothetical protein